MWSAVDMTTAELSNGSTEHSSAGPGGKGRELWKVTFGDSPTATIVTTADAAADKDVANEYRSRLANARLNGLRRSTAN